MMTPQLQSARDTLADEWRDQVGDVNDHRGADDAAVRIARFYRDSENLGPDLEAWHALPQRQAYTATVVTIAQQIKARKVLDIGCGAAHDLRVLRAKGFDVAGVEPNRKLRVDAVLAHGIPIDEDVRKANVEDADLVLLMDVLEHVVDPEDFLSVIAARMRAGGAKPGAVLIESTSTHDTGTPLHLRDNRGWHPGHALEAAGFSMLESVGPIRVWQRARLAPVRPSRSLIVCAYRTITIPTFNSVQKLMGRSNQPSRWRVMTRTGDALVSRARSIVASMWLRETADDVFLMVDDDITFSPEAADRVAKLAEERGIAAAAYPVRNGKHLALRGLGGPQIDILFGPDLPPVEIEYAGTGFMAVRRDVVEDIAASQDLLHETERWAFWPMFATDVVQLDNGERIYLSEDWAFCERARRLGHHVWLDPSVRVGHLASLELNTANMTEIAKAHAGGFEGESA